VLKIAMNGPDPVIVPLPITIAPSLKVTVPVGVPLPGLVMLTVAVKVTDWPKAIGLPVLATVAVVVALLIA
jgi:hypothetical protein